MASPYSVASSTGSPHGTISVDDSDSFNFDFNPDRDEALCSTYPIKRNRARSNVPDLRDTAKKYGRWSPRRPHQDIIVNTSALANAFPDFSFAGSDNDTFSVELPRGPKGKQRITSQPTPRNVSQNISSALNFSGTDQSPQFDLPGINIRVLASPEHTVDESALQMEVERAKANGGILGQRSHNAKARSSSSSKVQKQTSTQSNNPKARTSNATILEDASRATSNNINNIQQAANTKQHTPKHNRQPVIAKDAPRNTSNPITHFATEQKENIPPVTQPKSAKRSPYTSNASRTISGERRTLKELHARVADEADSSFISERPTTTTIQPPKNSRFTKVVQPPVTEHIFTPVPGEKPNNATSRSFFMGAPKSNSNTQTTQPAALPVVQQGHVVKNDGKRTSFGPVNDMDCPQEEKDIYKLADDLKLEVAQLKLALQQQRSPLAEENESLRTDVEHANKKLEQVQAQHRLDMQQQQSRLREENQALKQEVEVAYKTVDHLQTQHETFTRQVQQKSHLAQENQKLQLENQALGRQIDQLLSEQENGNKEQAALRSQLNQLLAEREETTRSFHEKETALTNKLQRSERTVDKLTRNMSHHMKEHTEILDIAEMTAKQEASTPKKKSKSTKPHNSQHPAERPQSVAHIHQQAFGVNAQKARDTTVPIEQHDDSFITQEGSINGHSDDSSHITEVCGPEFSHQYHEFMKKSKAFVASHKARLEPEEQASVNDDSGNDTAQTIQSGRSSHAPSIKGGILKNVSNNHPAQDDIHDDTIQTIQSGRSSHAPSVRSGILKSVNPPLEDLTGAFSIKSATSNKSQKSNTHRRNRSLVEEDHTARSTTSHRRHHSETNFHTRRQDDDDMTSAYLAADIEAAKQSNDNERPVLSPSARRVLDGLCEHNRMNCIICLRVTAFENTSANKKTIRVQKPVPVSKRALSPVPYEDEPTLRPAVAPGIALATVMKGMEDEHAHLKMRLAEITEAYMKHDVALGRRKRERLEQEMEKLQKQLKDKSNQIYALNDVLEGQVQSGQEMTQEEIDVTWMSGEYEEELPWEGIEESV